MEHLHDIFIWRSIIGIKHRKIETINRMNKVCNGSWQSGHRLPAGCNILENTDATTYIFILQFSAFGACKKQSRSLWFQ